MSHAYKFSSSPPQTDVAQGSWVNTRKQSRNDNTITAAVETAKTASAEKRRRRARKAPVSDIRDVGGMECVGDETSTIRITNQVNRVQQVHMEMYQKIKELTYIIHP